MNLNKEATLTVSQQTTAHKTQTLAGRESRKLNETGPIRKGEIDTKVLKA